MQSLAAVHALLLSVDEIKRRIIDAKGAKKSEGSQSFKSQGFLESSP
jgi:hypothetical protein